MTFKEMMLAFMKDDPTRWDEDVISEEEKKKYEFDQKLYSKLNVLAPGAAMITFDLDVDGNLLEFNTWIVNEAEALREVANQPGLAGAREDALLEAADFIDESNGICSECGEPIEHADKSTPKTDVVVPSPPKKTYLN